MNHQSGPAIYNPRPLTPEELAEFKSQKDSSTVKTPGAKRHGISANHANALDLLSKNPHFAQACHDFITQVGSRGLTVGSTTLFGWIRGEIMLGNLPAIAYGGSAKFSLNNTWAPFVLRALEHMHPELKKYTAKRALTSSGSTHITNQVP